MTGGLIQRASDLYRQEGMMVLLDEAQQFLRRKAIRYSSDVYWYLRGGTQELNIDNVTATFDATSPHGGDTIRWMYQSERTFLFDLVKELEPNDTLFDIGANIGIFSCFAVQTVSDGKTVAFEPYPPNVRQLQRNLSYNGSESEFTVIDAALSDSYGRSNFTAPNNDPGNQTATMEPDTDKIEVPTIPGDYLVSLGSVPSPSVVKIDVEGAEPLVIRGLEKSLSDRKCRTLYCEIHLPREGARPSVEDYGESRESILDMISDLGFNIEYQEQRGAEVQVKATK
jgi:FkbM family methyltransferase